MTFKSTTTYTLQDFLQFLSGLPTHDVNRYELIQGRIVMTPPAGFGHGRTESRVVSRLSNFVFQHQLGEAFGSSGGFSLPSGDLVQPDFAFVSKERLAAVDQSDREFSRAVPNLVVEILSPSTAKIDQTEKKTVYEANGVDEYWIVDPEAGRITVFQISEGRFDSGTVYSGTQQITSRVLPGFSCPLRDLLPQWR